MDDNHIESVDEILDRELARALDVQPSPTFAARVRERVAEQRPRWSHSWLWLPAAAAAAVVLASWVATFRQLDDKPVQQATREGRERLSAPTTPQPTVTPTAVPPVPLGPSAPARQPHRTRVDSLDYVLVSREESSAIRALLDSVKEGRVDPATFLNSSVSSDRLLSAIEIPLLAELAPIVVAPLSEGVDQ